MSSFLASSFKQTLACPFCERMVTVGAFDTIRCTGCGEQLAFFELSVPCSRNSDSTPSLCSTQRLDNGVKFSASHRSLSRFIALAVFATIWNGLTGATVILIGWGARHADNVQPGELLLGIGFLSFGAMPFVLTGGFITVMAVYAWYGRTEVLITDHECRLTRRLFSIRWSKSLDRSLIRGVKLGRRRKGHYLALLRNDGQPGPQFGVQLPYDRVQWLRSVIAELFPPDSQTKPLQTFQT